MTLKEIENKGVYVKMSQHYKEINNEIGVILNLDNQGNYISIGQNGEDVTIAFDNKCIVFKNVQDMVDALDISKSFVYVDDNVMRENNLLDCENFEWEM